MSKFGSWASRLPERFGLYYLAYAVGESRIHVCLEIRTSDVSSAYYNYNLPLLLVDIEREGKVLYIAEDILSRTESRDPRWFSGSFRLLTSPFYTRRHFDLVLLDGD